MSMEQIGAIAAIGAPTDVEGLLPPAPAQPVDGGFANWFAQEVGRVDHNLTTVQNDIRTLASGEAQSLHEVMIHMEEAKLSFQLLAQVRNRVLEAYQEVMRTQV